MQNYSVQYSGVAYKATPFITDIVAPQLKLRGMPVTNCHSLSSLTTKPPSFILAEAHEIKNNLSYTQKEQIRQLLQESSIGIAFCISKDYKLKVELLDIGFSQCIELPAATEVIIKTIENSVKKVPALANQLREPGAVYCANKTFDYLYDNAGHPFLMKGTRAIHLNQIEKRLLDYFGLHSGILALSELAFAGWRTFSIKNNTVVCTIKRLRKKIAEAKLPYTIRSIYGYGYMLESLLSDFRGDNEIHRLT